MKAKLSLNRKELARRLREIRLECYGADGEAELAADLDLPARTWRNYESGVTIPGFVLLVFIERTRANPTWLLTGLGERFVDSSPTRISSG